MLPVGELSPIVFSVASVSFKVNHSRPITLLVANPLFLVTGSQGPCYFKRGKQWVIALCSWRQLSKGQLLWGSKQEEGSQGRGYKAAFNNLGAAVGEEELQLS